MEKKHGTGEIEQEVDALLAAADQLLTVAEQTQDPTFVYEKCRAAVGQLLLAYLLTREGRTNLSADSTIGLLWEKSVACDPEILLLADQIRYFLDEIGSVPNGEEMETILDAANEIWDFIYDSFPEVET
ncbi:MAG: hypothetical protein GX202_02860 [Firmicutes bacterium]|nr:hypothetical protein [Bacillota bacterium]